MFEGKPMAGGGAISFVPTGGQSGKVAGGEIKPDGTYELMTYRPGDGSMVGEFRVIVTQTGDMEGPPTEDGETALPTTNVSSVSESDRIPEIYSDYEKSPLNTKVEAKPLNELNFDLKRSAGPPPQTGAG